MVIQMASPSETAKNVSKKTLISRLAHALKSGTVPEGISAIRQVRDSRLRSSRVLRILCEVVRNPDGWYPDELRSEAMDALAKIYPARAVPVLEEIVKDSYPMNFGARKSAIAALGTIQLRSAVKILSWVVDPSNEYVDLRIQADALSALSKNNRGQASEELVQVAIVRREEASTKAVQALSEKATPRTVMGLARVLEKGENPSARAAAAAELGKMELQSAASALRNFIRKELSGERAPDGQALSAAISALGNFKDEKSTILIAKVLRERKDENGYGAEDALKAIGTPLASRLLARAKPTPASEKMIVVPLRPAPEEEAREAIAQRVEGKKTPPFGSREEASRIAAPIPAIPPNPYRAEKKKRTSTS